MRDRWWGGGRKRGKEGLLEDLNGLINYFGGSFVTKRGSLIGLMTSELVATLSTFVEIPQRIVTFFLDTAILCLKVLTKSELEENKTK